MKDWIWRSKKEPGFKPGKILNLRRYKDKPEHLNRTWPENRSWYSGQEVVKIVNVSYCSIILMDEGRYGTVTSEYSPLFHLEPSLGEQVNLKDCPTLDRVFQGSSMFWSKIRQRLCCPRKKPNCKILNTRSILWCLCTGEKSLGSCSWAVSWDKEFSDEESTSARRLQTRWQ